MKFKIRDFGIISSAEIEVAGLTVISGENDTGKSTIGKIVFSTIKSLASYQTEFLEDREVRISEIVQEIYFSLRRYINFSENAEVRNIFLPPSFSDEIRLDKELAVHKRIIALLSIEESKVFDRKMREKIQKHLSEILAILSEPVDGISAMKAVFKRTMILEFKRGIIQKSDKAKRAVVDIVDGENSLISFSWSSDEDFHFKFYDALGFNDATYVDSTSVLQMHGLMDFVQGFRSTIRSLKSQLPLHMTDIAYKLRNSIYNVGVGLGINPISSELSKIYGGKFYFDKEKMDFVFEKNGFKLSSEIVASGIKSLGMIDMLLQSNVVNASSMLILDEPETNLHPKWQVKYAELICDMVDAGANVIVSTHSPYMLEALNGYASKRKIQSQFYLSYKKDDGYVSFKDISENIAPAIEFLSAPLVELNQELYGDF